MTNERTMVRRALGWSLQKFAAEAKVALPTAKLWEVDPNSVSEPKRHVCNSVMDRLRQLFSATLGHVAHAHTEPASPVAQIQPTPEVQPKKKREPKPKVNASSPPPSDASKADVAAWFEKWKIPQKHPEALQFLDRHRAKGNKFIDWTAAWRTWLRNSERFSTSSTPPPFNPPPTVPKYRAFKEEPMGTYAPPPPDLSDMIRNLGKSVPA